MSPELKRELRASPGPGPDVDDAHGGRVTARGVGALESIELEQNNATDQQVA